LEEEEEMVKCEYVMHEKCVNRLEEMSIKIDGVDISTLGLNTLRSRLSIIP